jgi:hypothetical protein
MTVARPFKIALLAIMAVAALPVAMLLISGIVALAGGGCAVDEGNPHPCVVLGIDFGGMLYALSLLGLLGLIIAWPLAGIALLIWLVVAGIAWLVRRRRQRVEMT